MALVNFLSSGPVWALLLLSASLLLLYWLAPDIQKSIRWVLPGTALATLAILIVFAAMDLIFGVLEPWIRLRRGGERPRSALVALLLSTIVIVGGIVNAVLGRRYDRKLRDSLRRHPEKRLERRDRRLGLSLIFAALSRIPSPSPREDPLSPALLPSERGEGASRA